MNTQKKPKSKGAAAHVRMEKDELREIEIIAEREGRPLSDAMRCLLRLGISEYHVTGTLYSVHSKRSKTRSRKEDGEGEEHRIFLRYLRKILKAADEYVSKETSLETK